MKISKILWSVVLVVAVIIVLDRVNKIFFIPKTSGDLQKKTPLIVGMMAGYAPFMTVNEDGDYEGFDVDVAKEFAKRMKREIRYKVMDLSELLFALDRKKIDLLVSGLTMTPERKKRIDMVHYHGGGQKTIPMAFWKEIPAGVKTLDDMAKMGLSVVVESGSSWEDCAGVVGLTKTKGFAHYPEM
ncbi:transporter substrate-binding domain-containing protein, partial [Candidatus Babeliales bacterium]|nr:transporter substrate-binding domain-containing protein [Candidatus Babeliales bacterium]